MIGIICKSSETEIVKEFFQLFKTPWEFFQENHKYEVVICTRKELPDVDAKLLIVFNTEKSSIDSKLNININSILKKVVKTEEDSEFPIYNSLVSLDSEGTSLLNLKDNSHSVAQVFNHSNGDIIRVGYDIFQEAEYLLKEGQPPEFASIPTLDIHLSLLRNWIISAGISFIEIPPVPAGYKFMACLTHDVDYITIKQHKFDHTMWGFLSRATIDSSIKFLRGKLSLRKLLKNWNAVLTLPLVYLGIIKDLWFNFDRYMELEKEYKSTFFIIPFKNKAGESVYLDQSERRATKYDIVDIRKEIQKLIENDFEIALHGIDAWHSSQSAKDEFARVTNETKNKQLGIRMHWLCYDSFTPAILDEAGFLYDSTFGYNETVGFRAGTSQVFRPPGTTSILELPLSIQDVALFMPGYLNLSDQEGLYLCHKILHHTFNCGGVITILWHLRSIAPERLWDDFYMKLLETLKDYNVFFATATQAVQWYSKRRTIEFKEVTFEKNHVKVKLLNNEEINNLSYIIRVHTPYATNTRFSQLNKCITDVALNNKQELSIPI